MVIEMKGKSKDGKDDVKSNMCGMGRMAFVLFTLVVEEIQIKKSIFLQVGYGKTNK